MAEIAIIAINSLLDSPSWYSTALITNYESLQDFGTESSYILLLLNKIFFFYSFNHNQVLYSLILMAFNYRYNTTAYISCLMEFTQRNSKSNFRKVFTSSMSCIDFQFSLSEAIVDVDELPCQLICNVGDLLQEPTEGSVGVCTGSFCDFGGTIGIKITVVNINE